MGRTRETPACVDGCVFGESGRRHLAIAGCACEDRCRCQTFTFCSSVTQQHRGDLTAASASSSALKGRIPFSMWPFPSLRCSLFPRSVYMSKSSPSEGRWFVQAGPQPGVRGFAASSPKPPLDGLVQINAAVCQGPDGDGVRANGIRISSQLKRRC